MCIRDRFCGAHVWAGGVDEIDQPYAAGQIAGADALPVLVLSLIHIYEPTRPY